MAVWLYCFIALLLYCFIAARRILRCCNMFNLAPKGIRVNLIFYNIKLSD